MRMTGASKSLEGDQRGEGGVVIFLHGVRRGATFHCLRKISLFWKSDRFLQVGGSGAEWEGLGGLIPASAKLLLPTAEEAPVALFGNQVCCSWSVQQHIWLFVSATQVLRGVWRNIGFDGYKENEIPIPIETSENACVINIQNKIIVEIYQVPYFCIYFTYILM